MSFFSLLLLAAGLSMDAFAMSISQGAALKKISFRRALRNGLIFGVVEGLTPLIGWALGYLASGLIVAWGHWLAFILLIALAGRMIYAGCQRSAVPAETNVAISPTNVWLLVLMAIATSIDALAIGIGLAFLHVNIFQAALAIGCVSAIMSTLGIISGHLLSAFLGRWAEIIGGLVLTGIAIQILINHFYH